MATTAPRLQVRLALADFVGGATPLPAFEESIAKVLAAQGSGRGEVEAELHAAVNDGTLPPESLRRLGLIGPAASQSGGVGEAVPADRNMGGHSAPPSIRPSVKSGVLLGGRYRLDRELGEGGMGVVFSAVDEEVRGEVFAVKVMKAEIREKPDSLRMLRNEVRRTRALRHANIVGVYSLNSDPVGVYMLMEHLEGKSLTALLDEEFGRGMPLIRAWPVIWDIGAALAYAHDHNVIHSDLKPSNIFITTSGSAKLLDFGIARAIRTRSRQLDPTLMGGLTPAYASVEMFEGCTPDQSDDVYSFACVIYEMLTGKHPFDRMSSVDAHARQRKPVPIPALTNRQNTALARALGFERAQRTSSVEELLEGLKGMATSTRRKRMRIGSAAMALVAIGLALYLELRERQPATGQTARPSLDQVVTQPYDAGFQNVPKPEPVRPVARVGVNASASRKNDADALVPIKIPFSARKFSVEPEPVPLSKAEQPRIADLQKSLAAAVIPAEMPATVAIEAPAPKPAAPPAPATPTPVASTMVAAAAAAPAVKPVARAVAAPADAPTAAPSTTPAVLTVALPANSAEVSSPQPLPVSTTRAKDAERPPPGMRIPSINAFPESSAVMNSEKCPYPVEARDRVETGTVELLVHVTPEGTAPNPQIAISSGSDSLDDAAVNCVREYGRFPPRPGGKPGSGYWGRTKFIWSFGG